jgi:hypothetical protein
MGSGGFHVSAAAARAAYRASSGSTIFTHQDRVNRGLASPLQYIQDIRIKGRRESRDFPDKPASFPIFTAFDTTGSMCQLPYFLASELSKLAKTVEATGAIPDPQYAFGVFGDGQLGDPVPFAISEFEADDELIEKSLSYLFLDNSGFGNVVESYETVLYAAGHMIQTDAYEKRGKKGVLLIIGDEAAYNYLEPKHAKKFLGVRLEEKMSIEDIVLKAKEMWEIYLLRPGNTAYESRQDVIDFWRRLLGAERVISVKEWENLVPVMAGIICGVAGLSDADRHRALVDAGFDNRRASTATDLVHFGGGGNRTTTSSGQLPATLAPSPTLLEV